MKTCGYGEKLFVLPFDHRASFARDLLGKEGDLSLDDIALIKDCKRVVFEAAKLSSEKGVPKSEIGILCDDIFGLDILKEAVTDEYIVMMTLEKSGEEYFVIEHGDYLSRLQKLKPKFAKALVRYNPTGDKLANLVSLAGLAKASKNVRSLGIKFLVEPLVAATDEQMEMFGGDKHAYDISLRPRLVAGMIKAMYDAGVEVDVWKIEGFEKAEDYKLVVDAARSRDECANVGVIILGRNETMDNVLKWVVAGRSVLGVVGFAVGRTLFMEPLRLYISGQIDRSKAANIISDGFLKLKNTFEAN